MKKIFVLSLFTYLLNIGIAQADFNRGVVAYLSGDYDKAFTTMQSLGETTDHGLAQYYMGMMYLRGQGVDQSYENASMWFNKAAKQGIAQAQHKLGRLYMKGQGVPKDYEYAYAWFSVAVIQQHKKSINDLEKAKIQLNEKELIEAQKLANEFISKYQQESKPDPNKPAQF